MRPLNPKNILQHFTISTPLATFSALLALAWSTVSLGDNTVHLGEAISSKEAIIDILQPKMPNTQRIVTRGLQLNSNVAQPLEQATAEIEAPRSLSLIINFEFDSATLTPSAVRQLKPLGEALSSNELTAVSFTLEGHTDAQGSDAYNLNLSNARAVSVRRFLSKNYNLDANRINTYGKGETELLDQNSPFSRENRRVVVIAH